MARLGCARCHAPNAQASNLRYRLSVNHQKLTGKLAHFFAPSILRASHTSHQKLQLVSPSADVGLFSAGAKCSGRKVQLARQRHIFVKCCDDSSSHDAGHSHDSSHSSGWDSHDTSHSSSSNHHHSSHKHHTEDDADDASFPDFLDVASMFDTGDSEAVSYRPSSGQSYKQPGLPASPDFWAYKPVWCQPWSILVSGTAFVAGARWISGGSNIATGVAAVPILVWWYLFLVLVPADFRKYAEEK